MKKQFFIAIVVLYLVLSVVFYRLSVYFPDYKYLTLEVGNTVMAVLSMCSYLLVNRGIPARPQAFVRGVFSASLLKLTVCMTAILVYVLEFRAQVHKPSVFILFGIYIVYTVLETWVLSKMARDKDNNKRQ